MTFRVNAIGQDNNKTEKYDDTTIKTRNYNDFYAQLKCGVPIIGNILNGSAATNSGQAAAQL